MKFWTMLIKISFLFAFTVHQWHQQAVQPDQTQLHLYRYNLYLRMKWNSLSYVFFNSHLSTTQFRHKYRNVRDVIKDKVHFSYPTRPDSTSSNCLYLCMKWNSLSCVFSRPYISSTQLRCKGGTSGIPCKLPPKKKTLQQINSTPPVQPGQTQLLFK